MNQRKRLIVMAGGTGGHVFPGITIANYLINKNWNVRWLGTVNHIEANLVPKYGIEIDFIRISSFFKKDLKSLLFMPLLILGACYQSRIIMKRFRPDAVLGMGGYVSGPGGLAAWSLGIPIILHEQNCIAGLTNRYLSKIASRVIQAFPGAFPNAEVVGNPIRTDILSLSKPEVRLKNRTGPLRLLIMGGSQGSQILNQIMPEVALRLNNKIIVLHQSGSKSKKNVEKAYSNIGKLEYRVVEFIEDMASAYDWADLVICRSGALTVSEIAVSGLAAIFVPFQHKDQQQYWNALMLEKIGAAKIIEQKKLNVDTIVDLLLGLNRQRLLEMAKRARTLAVRDAVNRIEKVISLITKKNNFDVSL